MAEPKEAKFQSIVTTTGVGVSQTDNYQSDFTYGKTVEQLDYNVQIRNKPTNPSFGTGEDGDLYVPAGVTTTLSPGTYNYRRIIVEATGTLTGNAVGTYVLKGSAENRIDGTLDFSGLGFSYVSSASSIATAYWTLSTGVTGQGGAGKSDWANGWEITNGWAAANWYGGGGGGGAVYVAPTHALGGNGWTGWDGGSWAGAAQTDYLNKTTETASHTGWAASWSGGGGEGAGVWSGGTFTVGSTGSGWYSDQWANGTAGWAAFISGWAAGFVGISGGGGGGWSLGKNGASIICYFNNLSGSGTITCAGDNWYAGWAGGAWVSYGWSYGRTWCGGGGGGGGLGWALAVYYSGTAASLTTVNTGGTGWAAGSGGSQNTGTQAAGFAGTAGTKTVVDITAF